MHRVITRPVAAGFFLCLGLLATVVVLVQTRMADCNWASAVGDWDSAHAFKDGSGFSGKLFLGCTILLASAAALVIDRMWVRFVVALPIWLAALIVVFILVVTANPCHASDEPSASVICRGDDWKTLDRTRYDFFEERGTFKSREECLDWFRGPRLPPN